MEASIGGGGVQVSGHQACTRCAASQCCQGAEGSCTNALLQGLYKLAVQAFLLVGAVGPPAVMEQPAEQPNPVCTGRHSCPSLPYQD